MRITLSEMKLDENGTIQAVGGGTRLQNRLSAIGLHPPRRICKVTDSFIGGPITIQVNGCLIAIGRGMAERIIVDVDRR